MKEGKKLDLGLTGLDKLFSTEQERMESQLPKIYDIQNQDGLYIPFVLHVH